MGRVVEVLTESIILAPETSAAQIAPLKPGDGVEVLKIAWIDQHGRPVFKGKLKRVAERIF